MVRRERQQRQGIFALANAKMGKSHYSNKSEPLQEDYSSR